MDTAEALALYQVGDYNKREELEQDYLRPGEVAREVAADRFFFGGLAVASEIEAAAIIGTEYRPVVPLPTIEHGIPLNAHAVTALKSLRKELREYRKNPADQQPMDLAVGDRIRALLQNLPQMGTLESILRLDTDFPDAPIAKPPQFLLLAKEQMGTLLGKDLRKYSWVDWFHDITDTNSTVELSDNAKGRIKEIAVEKTRAGDTGKPDVTSKPDYAKLLQALKDGQVVNFAQWYSAHTEKLLTSKGRKQHALNVKRDYLTLVDAAMDGENAWLNRKHRGRIHRSIQNVEIRTFSPFDQAMDQYAEGVTQLRRDMASTIYFPSIVAPVVSVHETNHAAMEVNYGDLYRYAWNKLGAGKLSGDAFNQQLKPAIDWLYIALNEGFNDHCTLALLEGGAEVVDPDVRRDTEGLRDKLNMSSAYRPYHKIFGAGITGTEENMTNVHIMDVIDAVLDPKINLFEYLVEKRWQGYDIFVDLLNMVQENITLRSKDQNNPEYGAETLSVKIAAHLEEIRKSLREKAAAATK